MNRFIIKGEGDKIYVAINAAFRQRNNRSISTSDDYLEYTNPGLRPPSLISKSFSGYVKCEISHLFTVLNYCLQFMYDNTILS